ncbi:MAG: hypothetical protein GEU88_01010 [Solirubrobacterales bacterium]|nr:hypothetical protein [Solirubrobacterales bacterium]
MNEPPRRAAANHNRDRRGRPRRAPSLAERPDRIALWAVVLAVVAMIAGAASARAGIGGVAAGSGSDRGGPDSASSAGIANSAGLGAGADASGCLDTEFGRRTLQVGDCGDDVATLNWILRSDYREAPLADSFADGTEAAVARFQSDADLPPDGVVDETTSRALVRDMSRQRATWYGPGLYGNPLACGGTLRRATVGVAHKTLPCGSKVVIRYKGHYVRTRVLDRGPFSRGLRWDLTQAAADRVGLEADGAGKVRVASIPKPRKR